MTPRKAMARPKIEWVDRILDNAVLDRPLTKDKLRELLLLAYSNGACEMKSKCELSAERAGVEFFRELRVTEVKRGKRK